MINLKTDNFEIDNIDTILFDKDGTFIDLHYFWGKMTEMRVLEIIKRFNLKEDLFSVLCLKLGYDTLNGKMLKDGITAMYSRPVIIEIFCKDLNNLGVSITEFQIEEDVLLLDRFLNHFLLCRLCGIMILPYLFRQLLSRCL